MDFLPWDRVHRVDPHSFWNRWRDSHGVESAFGPQTGRTFYFIMRHSDVSSVLLSPTIGEEPERYLPDGLIDPEFAMEGPFAVLGKNMWFVDPPDHTRLRRLIRDGFSNLRWAFEDQTMGDARIPQGGMIVAVLMAANRDLGVFDDPDRFDVTRNPKDHLAFGSGIHHCLGAPVARREARIAFGPLNAQVGRLEQTVDRSDRAWTPDTFLRGAAGIAVRRV